MKSHWTAALGIAATVVMLAAPATAEAQGPVATGSEQARHPVTDNLLTFSVAIVQHQNGSVSGQGQVQIHGAGGGRVKFQITSWMLWEGKVLYAGPIIQSSGGAPPVGLTFSGAVEDNGNGGPGESPDRMTAGGAFPPGMTVQDIFVLMGGGPPAFLFFEIEQGNIVVH